MEKKSYKKSIIREITSSKARFISILVIIFLGVAFYSGIKSTKPDMNKSINKFYNSQNLMDSKIISTLGLVDNDLEILKDDENILDFYGTHTIDAKLDENLRLGDEYIIESDEETMKSFKEDKYKVVGIVKSPIYIEKGSRGVTSIGKGTIDYFAVLNSEDISMDVYTEIYLRFKNVQGLDTYSDEYT